MFFIEYSQFSNIFLNKIIWKYVLPIDYCIGDKPGPEQGLETDDVAKSQVIPPYEKNGHAAPSGSAGTGQTCAQQSLTDQILTSLRYQVEQGGRIYDPRGKSYSSCGGPGSGWS